jgi:hypothetical protein
LHIFCFLSTESAEEELGSSEESGKDWDELEEEARKGNCLVLVCVSQGVAARGIKGSLPNFLLHGFYPALWMSMIAEAGEIQDGRVKIKTFSHPVGKFLFTTHKLFPSL